MKYQFVTSMHKPYYDHIGQVMIESWLKYWNRADMELVVYGEDFNPGLDDSRLVWKDWREHCEEDHTHFVNIAAGLSKGRARTFAKKGLAFLDAMKNTKADRLIWLDADLLFYKEIDYDRFDALLDDDKLIAFFDQFFGTHPKYTQEEYINLDTRKSFGAESGFVIVNPAHNNYGQYVKNYKTLYSEKDPEITHWFDSEVVVLAARPFLKQVFDLSSLRTTNKSQTPLNRCWLTEYFSHHKAKSKTQYSIKQLRDMCGLV